MFFFPYIQARKDSSGFTLIELLVVVVILGVLASTISLSLSITDRSKAKQFARELVNSMSEGSYLAITEGKIYALFWNPHKYQFFLKVKNKDIWEKVANFSALTAPEQMQVKQIYLGSDESGREAFLHVDENNEPEHDTILSEGFKDVQFNEVRFEEIEFNEVGFENEDLEKNTSEKALIVFESTGLWQPEGQLGFYLQTKFLSVLEWSATGKTKIFFPNDSTL